MATAAPASRSVGDGDGRTRWWRMSGCVAVAGVMWRVGDGAGFGQELTFLQHLHFSKESLDRLDCDSFLISLNSGSDEQCLNCKEIEIQIEN